MMARLGDFLLGLAMAAVLSGTVLGQTRAFAPRMADRLGAPAPQTQEYPDAPLAGDPGQDDAPAIEPRSSPRRWFFSLFEGRTQIEGGYSFAYDTIDGSHATQHVVPDLMVRYGLTDRLELRIGWPGYVSTRFDGPLADRSSDAIVEPNLGFMFDLWPQRGWLPQTAVLASVPIPLRGNPFTMESLQPLSQTLYCWDLNDRLTLGGSTGLALFRVDGDDFIQLQQTVSLDWGMTERVGGFAEWEMLADYNSNDDGTQHLMGGGFSFLLTDRFQLTWRAGVGLNGRAPDFVTGIYFVLR